MNKKVISILGSAVAVGLLTTACGSNNSSVSKKEDTKTSQAAPKKEHKSEYYFDGTTANIRDLKIKITGVKFYKGTEESGKKLIVFEYDLTNKTNKEIDVNTGWQAVFTAYQDNKNTDGQLEVGAVPNNYEKLLNNQTQNIKKNGHLNFVVAYELRDDTTPVVLKATKGPLGREIGKKTYKIGKFEQQSDPSVN
ncbi:MAG: DUF5067 domain-containing protein [Lactobacillus crispatus]|nr:DUF5067 domain-containing protein [Lactobacillus crispatus]